MSEQRRLAAILVADVVGYSKLMGRDEAGTLARLQMLRSDVIEPAIAKNAGRLFKAVGDGFLVEFASAVQAVQAAQAIQQVNSEGELPLRIGIHVGDVVVQGDDLMGDGINVAARIEAVAEAGGIALSRQAYDQVRDRLDFAFEDRGEIELKNIARPVHVFAVAATGSATSAAAPALALPDKPSIAVLPFQNMSGDPEQEYFVDGLVEDIITTLSRFKSLFVIARNSSFTYKGKAVDIKQVGRELGVRYVLEGSVRKAGSRLRITGQLVEGATGAHVWAERYDGDSSDLFELQDKVTLDIVGAITPRLEEAELERAQRKPTASHDAHDCYLRATAAFNTGHSGMPEALQLCYRAIELDPGFAAAHAMAAFCNAGMGGRGAKMLEEVKIETSRLARRAVELDHNDAVVLSRAAWVQAFVVRDLDTAAGHVELALALNPNLAIAWAVSGWVNVWLGNPEHGIEHFNQATRLSPLDPNLNMMRAGTVHAYFMAGRYVEALSIAAKTLRGLWRSAPSYRIAAASAAMSGRLEEARKFATLMLELDPGRRISNVMDTLGPYRRPEDIERYKEGLRLAGLPE